MFYDRKSDFIADLTGLCTFNRCNFLKEFFTNPAFHADGLKIYPTLVIRGTGESYILR